MKKVLGLIVLIILLVAIFVGLGYKMIEPDGWDRIIQQVTGQTVPEATPTAEPTAEPDVPTQAPAALPTEKPAEDKDDKDDHKPKATPTVAPSATPAPTPTVVPDAEVDFDNMTYEVYYNLPPEIQQQYFETFENPMDFVEWHGNAKKEYDEIYKNEIEIAPDGSINLEDYINNSSSDGN